MGSKAFVDSFGTTVVVRMQPGHEHVQLLMVFADASEPVSYGFTPADFATFIELATELNAELAKPRCAVCGGPDDAGNGCEHCPSVDA